MTDPGLARADDRSTRIALAFLFLGNVVIGAGVLAPAAMLNAMAADLGVDAVAIGGLVGWGAVILCVGAPVFAFLTNRVGRRALLAASLAIYAIGHGVSAVVSDYDTLLGVRLLMISGAAVFTPQAASAVALMVPESRRPGAVALVFMGWAFAGAVVVPAMTLVSDAYGWRIVYVVLAAGAGLATAGVALATPARLYAARMSLASWGGVFARPVILLLLLTTALLMAGQFTLYPYLASELRRVTLADAGGVALVFGLYGAAGLAGSIVATRIVGRIGAPRTQLIALLCLAGGLLGWSLFAASYVPTAVSMFVWGLGFGAGVSMQQARLIAVAPPLASASVALNTSFLYLGQASGSAIGGWLISTGSHGLLGPAGLTLVVLALIASLTAFLALRA